MTNTELTVHGKAFVPSSTDKFYDEHADEYFQRTIGANLEHLYLRFLPLVKTGGLILDVGCGSGRDLRAFKEKGYRPFGIDSSAQLIQRARAYAGVECEVLRFQEVTFKGEFDAVWACASLLHVAKIELVDVLRRLRRALRPNGIFFAAVQTGQSEQLAPDGRFYAYYEEREFLYAIHEAGLTVGESWGTEDSLPNRRSVAWINVLARA